MVRICGHTNNREKETQLKLFLLISAAFLALRWAEYATYRRRTFQEATYLTMLCEWSVPEDES